MNGQSEMDDGNEKHGFYNDNIKGSINHGFTASDILQKDNLVLKIDTSGNNVFNENTHKIGTTNENAPIVEQKDPLQQSVRRTLVGCLLGLLAAFMLAVGQGCIQVS